MPLEAVETLFECENCEKLFKSPQGLTFHAKVMHSIIPKEDLKTSKAPVMQSDEELISLSVKNVVENLVIKLSAKGQKVQGQAKLLVRSTISILLSSRLKQSTPMTTGQIKKVSQNRLLRLKVKFQDGSKSGKPSSRMLHPLTESSI